MEKLNKKTIFVYKKISQKKFHTHFLCAILLSDCQSLRKILNVILVNILDLDAWHFSQEKIRMVNLKNKYRNEGAYKCKERLHVIKKD